MDEFDIAPPPRSRLPRLVAWTLGLGLLGIGGCIALVAGLGYWGLHELGADFREALEANPVVLEHLGELESCKIDLIASGNLEGDEAFAVDLVGSLGEGHVTAEFETLDDGRERVRSGTLYLEDGTRHELVP